MSKNDWVVIDTNTKPTTMWCQRCDRRMFLPENTFLDVTELALKRFLKIHKECRESVKKEFSIKPFPKALKGAE